MAGTAMIGTASSQRMWPIELMVSRMIPAAITGTSLEIFPHASRGAPGPVNATRTCAPSRAARRARAGPVASIAAV